MSGVKYSRLQFVRVPGVVLLRIIEGETVRKREYETFSVK